MTTERRMSQNGGDFKSAVEFFATEFFTANDAVSEPSPPESVAIAGDVSNRNRGRFHKIVAEIQKLHDMKQADYGTREDPLNNVRASEQWGIPAWVGVMVRINDKLNRLRAYSRSGRLHNEGVIDSLNDIAVYAIIARILFEEAQSSGKPTCLS